MSFTMDCDKAGCGWNRDTNCSGNCAYGRNQDKLRPCITEWGYYDVGNRVVNTGCGGSFDCYLKTCKRDCVAYDLLGSDIAFCDPYRNDTFSYNNCIETKTRC